MPIPDVDLTESEFHQMRRLFTEIQGVNSILSGRDAFLLHAAANIVRDAADLFEEIAARWAADDNVQSL